ncbi:SDR family NAD(P)-dependent oxidoreductase [Candidatus Bathyarchaeota archaeon]|nr:SDR family NAD(P)-dependent oxidoreductase [Candidatus Bathyarchaeota archaeon]
MDLGLKDRVALVTRSSQGIGRTIAFAFTSEGVRVVIYARNGERSQTVAQEIEATTGTTVLPIPTDSPRERRNLIVGEDDCGTVGSNRYFGE